MEKRGEPDRGPWGRPGTPRRLTAALATAGLLAAACGDEAPAPRGAGSPGGTGGEAPRNVIVFVADGMGYNYIDAASMYAHGTARYQVAGPPGEVEPVANPGEPVWPYEAFPHRYAMSTHTAHGEYDPEAIWADFEEAIGVRGDPETVTGSAAAATALSSGVKALDPAVGLDAAGEPVTHLAERAMELGKAAGVVADVPYNHATPAGFLAHNEDRDNRHEIAREMILDSGAHLIMGTGHPHFDDDGEALDEPAYFWTPEDVWTAVTEGESPYVLVEEREDFLALAEGETPTRVLGFPQVRTALQFNRHPNPLRRGYDEPGVVDPDEEPFETPFNDHVPTLAEMTRAGLNVLSNASDEGFFVMIEGGAADWGGHWNLLGRTIEEMLFFNEAVDAAVEWVERDSGWDETLMIVTSDHETGYLVGPGSNPRWTPLENRGAGRMPGHEWHHEYHTNHLVPLFARGPGAEGLQERVGDRHDPVRGPYVDNTDVADLVFEAWGRN